MSVQAAPYPPSPGRPELVAQLPCSHGSGCPLGVDVPAMVRAIESGDHPRAFLIARASNPFASTCGHGCAAPCETACRRGKFGAPVAIASLERFASGFAIPSLLASPEPCTSPHDLRSVVALVHRSADTPFQIGGRARSVAIIGGGLTGLACAHDLALLGHRAVIFESRSEAGGVVTSRMLAARLPGAAMRAEVAAIAGLGVEMRLSSVLDRPDAITQLFREGFEAVFVAIGAAASGERLFPAHDEDAAIDAWQLDSEELQADEGVVICGDEMLALDAAMLVARDGTAPRRDVHLVIEEVQGASTLAHLAALRRMGVTIHIGHRPSRILRADDGVHVAALELMNDSATDAVVIPCQRIVTAARRVPRASFLAELRVDEYGYVAADSSSLRTSHPRVWAGGACAFGHRSFAHAIADGKRGAWSIHAALTATRLHVTVASAWVELDEPTQIRAETALRVRRMSLPILERAPDDPFASGESYLADAAREASRCFDCAVTPTVSETCTGCSACLTACPTGALKLAGDPARAVVEQELCTRCGACVPSCPEGAIALLRAVWETRLSLEPEPSTMLGLIESPPSTQRTHRGLGSRGVPLPLHAL